MSLRKYALSLVVALGTVSLPACSEADEPRDAEHEAMARDMLKTVVAMDTSITEYQTPQMAAYLAGLFFDAGFAKEDVIQFEASPKHTALIVRYPGADQAAKGIAFIGHLDVVTAYAKDWELNPFELTERDGFFIGRGTADNKSGVVGSAATFLKLKSEGYVPDRNLYLIFSADEETSVASTKRMVAEIVPGLNLEYVLNTEGGGGRLTEAGEGVAYYVQGAEKTYATLSLTVRNPGGHSSAPRPDNAIYQLTRALSKVEAHRFPVMINEVSGSQLAHTASKLPEPFAGALKALLENPGNEEIGRAHV